MLFPLLAFSFEYSSILGELLELHGTVAPESREQGGDRSYLLHRCLEGAVARASWEVINKRKNVVGFCIFLLAFPSSPICPLSSIWGLPLKTCAAEVMGAMRRGGRVTVCPASGDAMLQVIHPSPVLARAGRSSVGNGAALGQRKQAALSCGMPEHPCVLAHCLPHAVVLPVW